MKLTRRLMISAFGLAMTVAMPSFAAAEGTIAIITPSHDNPFFKAEAVRLHENSFLAGNSD